MEHEGSEVVKKCVGLAVSLHRALLPFIHKHFHFTVYVAGILSVLEFKFGQATAQNNLNSAAGRKKKKILLLCSLQGFSPRIWQGSTFL